MMKIRKNYVSLIKEDVEEETDDHDYKNESDMEIQSDDESEDASNSDLEEINEEHDNMGQQSSDNDEDKHKNDIHKTAKRKQLQTAETLIIKKPKINNKNLYKPPTVDEINQLRETENLFHSNLFRLQIKEMLQEIKIKEKYKNFIISWLNNFNEFLLNQLESMEKKENEKDIKWLKKFSICNPLAFNNAMNVKPLQFQFLKPNEKAFITGSIMNGSIIDGSTLIVDIVVFMPSQSFQKDDYLNISYDRKRALYLMCLTSKIIEKKFPHEYLKFNYFHNNPLKPILQIVPSGNMAKYIKFQIFIAAESDTFKLNRFVPWNSNIRESLFSEVNKNDADQQQLVYATPCYNSTVLFDLTITQNHKLIEETICSQKALQEGLILLKIWLTQRNLDVGFCGFGMHIMTMFIIYLYKQKKIHSSMSSYQIARHVWNYLALSNWNQDGKGISLCADNNATENQPTLEQFHVYYEIVFIDSTGFLNLCSNLSLDMYLKVKSEAQRAVDLLNNKAINSFQLLFMTKIPIYLQFDHILKFCDEKSLKEVLQKHGTQADKHNFIGYYYPQLLKMISSILRKGLHDRVLSITPIQLASEAWNVTKKPRHPENSIILGFILNPEKAFEILDKGPQANEDNAEEFRKFWGGKSQLRRFQDGSITETCVWSSALEPLSKKRLIIKEIILHLLHHHFDVDENDIIYMANEFDVSYQLNNLFYLFEDGYNDAENTTLDLIKAFDSVGKNLRSIENLPLDIHSVQGISPVFRYCDPIPILAQGRTYKEGNKTLFQAYKYSEGVIQLGVSGKWPNDLKAFRRLKTAFHIQIAQSIRAQFNLEARGGIDGIQILKDGYVFNVEIFNPRELALLKKEVSEKGIVVYNDTEQSIEVEKRLQILPTLTSALHGLYQRYSSFGPTVMIAKRWFNSQMLDNYLWPEECTELLIASQYLKMGALSNPSQPQTGFFRFLHLLANTDWRNELFLLNFNDEMSQDEINQVENNFNTERDSFPPLCIATSYDAKKNSIWSKNAPTVPILARVTLLARYTLQLLEPCFTTAQQINVNDLFIASMEGYDLIINLRSNLIHTSLVHDFESLTVKSDAKIDKTIPAVGFDPAMKGLQELREAYSEFAIFFYNPYGGSKIAVIWKPEVFTTKEFKVNSVSGCQVTESGELKCNIPQLIEDFKIILKDLYFSIDNKSMVK